MTGMAAKAKSRETAKGKTYYYNILFLLILTFPAGPVAR